MPRGVFISWSSSGSTVRAETITELILERAGPGNARLCAFVCVCKHPPLLHPLLRHPDYHHPRESRIELWVAKSTVDTQILENTGNQIYHSLRGIGLTLGATGMVDSSVLPQLLLNAWTLSVQTARIHTNITKLIKKTTSKLAISR